MVRGGEFFGPTAELLERAIERDPGDLEAALESGQVILELEAIAAKGVELLAHRRDENEPGVIDGNHQFGGGNESTVQECLRLLHSVIMLHFSPSAYA